MHLMTRLTRWVSASTLALALVACAAPSPRKPAEADDKGTFTSLRQTCIDAQNSGNQPPPGCETNTSQRSRRLPDLQDDPLVNVPTLPALGTPRQGPLIGR